jgi:hypothetical protein
MRHTRATTHRKESPGLRHIHRLMDEVYREMYRLESGRPGSEMGLALALIRARVVADRKSESGKDWDWLKSVCPICLKMIEESLNRGSTAASLLDSSSTAAPKS